MIDDMDTAALVEFYTARLDDLEDAARRQIEHDRHAAQQQAQAGVVAVGVMPWPILEVGAPGDPEYVLADIAAKRAIIARAQTAMDLADKSPTMHAGSLAYRAVLRDLALPHAGHPDYRDEWRL